MAVYHPGSLIYAVQSVATGLLMSVTFSESEARAHLIIHQRTTKPEHWRLVKIRPDYSEMEAIQ